MTLTTLKEEVKKEFEELRWNHMGDGMYWVFPLLDSIVNKTYHATKEEVRNLVPKKRENFPSSESSYDRGFRRGYDMARGDLRSAIDALEDTTTSPAVS